MDAITTLGIRQPMQSFRIVLVREQFMREICRSVLLACIAFSVQTGVAHAGFFDMLFGTQGQPAAPSYNAPLDDSYLQARPFDRMRRPHKHVAAELKEDHAAIKEAAKTTDIMHDKTLRPGDAVVTEKGVRIFEGEKSSSHDGDDFIKVSEAPKLSPELRNTLDAIDAHRSQPSWQMGEAELPLQTGRSSASDAPQSALAATDKDGHTIRNVGP
jgi:hypothetical protein